MILWLWVTMVEMQADALEALLVHMSRFKVLDIVLYKTSTETLFECLIHVQMKQQLKS